MGPGGTWPAIDPTPAPRTTQEIQDGVAAVIDGWTEEEQIIAYKFLYAREYRIGASLDHRLSEIRRKRE